MEAAASESKSVMVLFLKKNSLATRGILKG
jgi:hypothetical protein